MQPGALDYQNQAWNRRLAGRWAGVAVMVSLTLLFVAAFGTRNLETGGKVAVLVPLVAVSAVVIAQIHRRYSAMKVWVEGDFLVVHNAFSEARLPMAEVRRGVWHVNRSGGMPVSVVKLRLDGRAAEIRVLTVPPAEAADFAARLEPKES